MFAMGRDGVLLGKVGEVHHRLRTPAAVVLVTTCIELIVGLPLGLSVGGDFTWYYLDFIATFALILVYGAINISLIVLMSGPLRAERRMFRDLVLPTLGTIAMLAALVGNVGRVPKDFSTSQKHAGSARSKTKSSLSVAISDHHFSRKSNSRCCQRRVQTSSSAITTIR